jgi:hypothetical protein
MPLDELALPVRAYNSLRRVGIHTVDDLSSRTEDELLAIENLGPQSVLVIKQRLAGVGRELAEPDGRAPAPGAGAPESGSPPATPAAPGPAAAGTPRAARPPDEDAIDLLSVAGFPVLKRALPVIGGAAAVLLVFFRVRGRRRRA